ncbi:hypothetical protein N0V84_006963 [Fusarium piperis]|uniref:Uncharacterized protein n=1 Tax=Fusarium piperis TaxID=1435070 RepID=A0A9W8WAU4_9HYPO|nr:hypothetical protein N0V84_006963 [Fusarium piperis]
MYIYVRCMYYSPYALCVPLYLVIETDFKLGAPVRAFWKWTVDADGNKNVNKLCQDNIDRVEAADLPTAGTTYGIFYDLWYPFDLFIGNDQSRIRLTMFSRAKSDPNYSQIATFNLMRVYSGRTTADDYNPVVALPDIRHYQLSTLFKNLFAMIVPANLCQDGTIWVTLEDNKYVYLWPTKMSVVDQSDKTIIVKSKCYRLKRDTGQPPATAETSDEIPPLKGMLSWRDLRKTKNSRFGSELSQSFLSHTVSRVVTIRLEESGTSSKSKITHLVPVLSPGASISQLSHDVLYSLDDGQIVFDNIGKESIYNTLNVSAQRNDGSDRNHDVIPIPYSNLVVVKFKKAANKIDERYHYSLAASLRSEEDVYSHLKADAGYIACSWSYNSYVYAYKLHDLVRQSASVTATSDTADRVYIATHRWLPWQRVVNAS